MLRRPEGEYREGFRRKAKEVPYKKGSVVDRFHLLGGHLCRLAAGLGIREACDMDEGISPLGEALVVLDELDQKRFQKRIRDDSTRASFSVDYLPRDERFLCRILLAHTSTANVTLELRFESHEDGRLKLINFNPNGRSGLGPDELIPEMSG